MFSCIYKLRQRTEKNPANQILDWTKTMNKESDIGVQKIFRIKASHYKKMKSRLPIIFMAKLNKGAKSIFINYEALRAQHPYLLIDFFEKRVQFHQFPEEPKDILHHQFPQSIDHHLEIRDMDHELKKEETQRSSRAKKVKKQSRERKEQRQLKDLRQLRNLRDSRDSRQERETKEGKQGKKEYSISMDSRPMRTCRLRSDIVKDNNLVHKETSQEPQEQIEKSAKSEQSQEIRGEQSVHQARNILDYDFLVETAFTLNLISPAVIPPVKLKSEMLIPQPLVPYQIPRINFKEMEREHYSSEQFKESEESQFLLDERSKDRRRRERLQKELERQKPKKKCRKIKKKTNSSSIQH